MQDRYTGDIGDFAKFGLLRALSRGRKLGIAWYLFPDESHNDDGKHIPYLDEPDKWRHLDPELFDGLRVIVRSGQRNVQLIEESGLLANAVFSSALLQFEGAPDGRGRQRADWFRQSLIDLAGCDLVFADPDNGLCEDNTFDIENRKKWKSLPLSEAHVLSAGRVGILYHHNTRRRGGHREEICHWLDLLGRNAIALRWRTISPRTFFILNPTIEIRSRVDRFLADWLPHCEFHTAEPDRSIDRTQISGSAPPPIQEVSKGKACPECGHRFSGKGWGGVDAHWKANHENIMPYDEAWPIIRSGGKPSDNL